MFNIDNTKLEGRLYCTVLFLYVWICFSVFSKDVIWSMAWFALLHLRLISVPIFVEKDIWLQWCLKRFTYFNGRLPRQIFVSISSVAIMRLRFFSALIFILWLHVSVLSYSCSAAGLFSCCCCKCLVVNTNMSDNGSVVLVDFMKGVVSLKHYFWSLAIRQPHDGLLKYKLAFL